MSSSDDALRRIDALVGVAMRLAGSAPSGRIALAKLAAALEPAWIPPPWDRTVWPELESAARTASQPISFREVERVLREAWGGGVGEELDALEPEPVATTPTSQVHRGVLDGETVAVKVLRPGLAAGVRQDLTLLEGLAGPLGSAFPALDVPAVLREVRERVLDELDLEHEAGVQRRAQRALRGDPHVLVPAPVTRLSHENVLVSQWVDGTPLSEISGDADGPAAKLVSFVLGGIRAGIVHADPDPDDVLVLDDGRIAVLDFGASRVVDAARADAALALVDAFAGEDATAFGAALERLGTLAARHGDTALALARHALGELGEPGASRLDVRAVVEIGMRIGERPREAVELLLAGSLPPEDVWPMRGVGQAFAVAARVGATADWLEVTRSALRDGWSTRRA